MDIENKAMNDSQMDEVTGGRSTVIVVGNNKELIFNCVECGRKFHSEEEWKAHSAETGHKLFGQRYE